MAQADTEEVVAGLDAIDGPREGYYIRGAFLGIQRPRDWEIDNRKVTSRPKIGLSVDGVEVSVIAGDDRELFDAQRSWVKGQVVTLRVYPQSGRFGLRWATSPASAAWE